MKPNKEDLPPTDGEWLLGVSGWFSMFNGRLHNSLGPAIIIYDDSSKQWWVDGKIHHLDGHAVEHPDGSKEWWVNCKRVSEQDFPSAVISFLLGVEKEFAKILEKEMKNDNDTR